MEIILFAVPFFFLLIAIELGVDYYKGTRFYRLNDALASLNLGAVSRMFEVVKTLIPLVVYALVFDNLALYTLPDTPLVWIVAFLIYDFFYYWNHRLGHEINILWAAHVVHHSSEEYNLTTALRQTSGSILNWLFFIPMALMGFDPALLVSVAALNLVYQFWVHTRHIDKLGWADRVFVTPSNHRVHHAQNDIYLDKNYGGVFIVWDRIFGTFQDELDEEVPIYGVRKPLHSWNPLYANYQVYGALLDDCIKTQSWKDKFAIWFKRTGWRPQDRISADPVPEFQLSQFRKFDIELSMPVKWYCAFQYVFNTAIALLLLLNIKWFSGYQQIVYAIFVIFICVSLGGILERKPWALWTETIKYLVLVAVCGTAIYTGFEYAIEAGLLVIASVTGWVYCMCERRRNKWQSHEIST